jgi:alginate O-acetyltransferase complex protein AlgJ
MELLFIGAFGLLLWLPAADNLLHLDHASAFNEKRVPAAFPTFTGGVAGLQTYVKGLEAYFNDHFGWRHQLIQWHSTLQVSLFGKKTNQAIVWGSDGWLYYFPQGERDRQDCRGQWHAPSPEFETLAHVLERRRDWLAQRGIRYLFVVAPNKQTIYPEHLPGWLKPVGNSTRFDHFLDYMRSHSTVPVLDLRPALREARKTAPTYYRTDSHWNRFGGFVACEEIIRALGREEPTFQPLPLEAFRLARGPGKGGDLTDYLGVHADDEEVTLQPGSALPAVVETVQHPEFVTPNYFYTNACASGMALVFRDSFGTSMRPFLGYHFKAVGYIWTAGDFNAQLIEQFKPNVVISEITDRKLNADYIAEQWHGLQKQL